MEERILFLNHKNKELQERQFRDFLLHGVKIFILLDENTRQYCLPELLKVFPLLESSTIIEIPSGEKYKTLESCTFIWQKLTVGGAGRSSLLLNLGGGVICDMGGFAAALYKRGIRFYHIPTTLLAQADACIGGKTGVDLAGLKNQIGLFRHADSILLYPEFLKTLDQRQFRSGLAEIIKIALVMDEELWHSLLATKNILYNFDYQLIERAMNLKSAVVAEDFTEQGKRKLLNFGHTLGHAIESLKMNSSEPVLHGEAVAAGMICETFLSVDKGFIDRETLYMLSAYILKIFGKVELKQHEFQAIIQLSVQDKKQEGGSSRYTLLRRLGEGIINQEVGTDSLEKALHFYLTLKEEK